MDAHSPLIEPPGQCAGAPTSRPSRCLLAVFGFLLSTFGIPPQGRAQEPDVALAAERMRPRLTVTRIEDAPVVDGRLDEPVWATAAVVDDFRVSDPVEGAPLPERTEVRILYSETAIYFGFRCFERDPEAVVASVLRRDAFQGTDDRIMILLDTFHDRRTGYAFSVNPNGARWDSLIEEGGGLNRQWDGIWYAAARRDDQGWIAEVAIPMTTLNFPENGTTWGLNLLRGITRLNQLGRWAYPSRGIFIFDVAHFGDLNGLYDLEQGIGLDVVPALAMRQVRNNQEGWVTDEGDPIIDVFYKITPSLTNVLTSNTDFSDAEPDRRRANLTRFSLFFPEQRDFFLQDAGIFNFANFGGGFFQSRNVNGQPFFSRTIGLTEDENLSIRFGEKLTGRIGPVNLGLLSTRVEGYDDVNPKWLSVGRVSLNVLEESTVGAIMTYGHPSENEHNKLLGADFNYRTSRMFGDQILEGTLWAQKTSSSGLDDKEGAFGASIRYPNDEWNWSLSASEFEENFNPALGFVNRVGIRNYRVRFRHRWRPGGNVRNVDAGANLNLVTGTDNDFQTLRARFTPVRIRTEVGGQLQLQVIYVREDLLEDFEIRDGIVIPKDHYRFDRYEVEFQSSDKRAYDVRVTATYGQFFSGTRFDTTFRIRWRPSARVSLGAEYEQFQIRLPEGDFTTRIARVNLDFAFSPNLSWTNLLQWDNETDVLTVSSRVRWIIEPGRELVLVLDPFFHRDDRLEFDSTTTEMVAKVIWTFRF